VIPRNKWYVGGCAARLSIAVGAGIGLDEGAAVGRRGRQGAEWQWQWLLGSAATRSKGSVEGAATEVL